MAWKSMGPFQYSNLFLTFSAFHLQVDCQFRVSIPYSFSKCLFKIRSLRNEVMIILLHQNVWWFSLIATSSLFIGLKILQTTNRSLIQIIFVYLCSRFRLIFGSILGSEFRLMIQMTFRTIFDTPWNIQRNSFIVVVWPTIFNTRLTHASKLQLHLKIVNLFHL